MCDRVVPQMGGCLIGQAGIHFVHEGARLVGTIFYAAVGEPRPTALVLHGIPGIEKHYDLAHALRDAGFNAVIFHYRGCWGSEGDYVMSNLPSDVVAALDHLSSGIYPEVEPDRFLLVGHSLGGWASIMAGNDGRVTAVVAAAPVVDTTELPFTEELALESFTPWLRGLTPEGFLEQWGRLAPATAAVGGLSKPLLIVHAEADEVIPVDQARRLFEAAAEPKSLAIHPTADHAFLEHRAWFRDTIVGWARSES